MTFYFPVMDMARPQKSQSVVIIQRLFVSTWYKTRSPQLAGILLAILGIVLLTGLILPQQPSPATPPADWIVTLPFWLQPWGEPLYFLQLSKIFQSPWLWVPVAFLLFHSLIALADYALPSWQRSRPAKDVDSLAWQHPLARRIEHSVRLPASPDELLDSLKETLAAKGFSVTPPFTDDERLIGATRWQWVWLGIITFYGGLILICLTLLAGNYLLDIENVTLLPFTPQESKLIGTLELVEIDGRSGVIVFTSKRDSQISQTKPWQLYIPGFFDSTLIWPTNIKPIITVEVRNTEDELVTLIPLREDLSPSKRLSLEQVDEPFYFLIPTSHAFQVSPIPESSEGDYNVQVRRQSETSPSENLMANLNQTFQVDDYSVTISLNHKIQLVVSRDWPLITFFILLMLIVVISAGLLFGLKPRQLWLVPEIKGRGGQLYGVMEIFYSTRNAPEFLKELLAKSTLPDETEL